MSTTTADKATEKKKITRNRTPKPLTLDQLKALIGKLETKDLKEIITYSNDQLAIKKKSLEAQLAEIG